MSEILFPLLTGILCIGAAFLALAGVIVLLYLNRNRSRKTEAVRSNWLTIPGRVVLAKVEEAARTKVDDDTFYTPYIEFEYTVAGQVYHGKQAVGRPSNLESLAKRKLAQYPPGTELVVNYDPEKPGEARLLLK